MPPSPSLRLMTKRESPSNIGACSDKPNFLCEGEGKSAFPSLVRWAAGPQARMLHELHQPPITVSASRVGIRSVGSPCIKRTPSQVLIPRQREYKRLCSAFMPRAKTEFVSFGTSDSQMFDQDEKLITKTPYLRLFAWTESSLPRGHRLC